jgi:hypothetical protein
MGGLQDALGLNASQVEPTSYVKTHSQLQGTQFCFHDQVRRGPTGLGRNGTVLTRLHDLRGERLLCIDRNIPQVAKRLGGYELFRQPYCRGRDGIVIPR